VGREIKQMLDTTDRIIEAGCLEATPSRLLASLADVTLSDGEIQLVKEYKSAAEPPDVLPLPPTSASKSRRSSQSRDGRNKRRRRDT
jgi:hypothetical protein